MPNHPSGGSTNDILYRKYVLTSSPRELVNIPSGIRDFIFYSNKKFSQGSVPNSMKIALNNFAAFLTSCFVKLLVKALKVPINPKFFLMILIEHKKL